MVSSQDDSDGRAEPSEYRGQFPAKAVSNPVGAVIESLLPPPIAKRDALNLFDGRATYGQITMWRHGARRLPPWAAEILDRKIAKRMAPDAELRALLAKAIGPGMQAGWDRTRLNRWRLKQKAGS